MTIRWKTQAIPVAAALLLGAAGVAVMVRRSPAPAVAAPSSRPAAPANAVPEIPPRLLATAPSGLAVTLSDILKSPDVKAMGEETPLPRSPAESACWETREALRQTLARNPAAWPEVIGRLAGGNSLDRATRVVVLARSSVNDQAESLLTGVLTSHADSGARRLAVTALANRTTSRGALLAAMEGDPDAGVRLGAMNSLAMMKKLSAPEASAEIREAIRRRGTSEPDPQIRAIARGLSGETPPTAQGAPPPPSPDRRLFDRSGPLPKK